MKRSACSLSSESRKKNALSELRGNTALDSSAIIEYIAGTRVGDVLRNYFETIGRDETVAISLFALSESFYILCRLKGPTFAKEALDELTSYVEVSSSTQIALQAGRIKCERSISLVDCSCLAVAKLTNARAVFATREEEIIREMKRKNFDVEIVFLEDLAQQNGSRR